MISQIQRNKPKEILITRLMAIAVTLVAEDILNFRGKIGRVKENERLKSECYQLYISP